MEILQPAEHYREPVVFLCGILDGEKRGMPGWGRIALVYVNPSEPLPERVFAWEAYGDLNKQLGIDSLASERFKPPTMDNDHENGVVLLSVSAPGLPPALHVYQRFMLISEGGGALDQTGVMYALDNGVDPIQG